MTTDWESLRPSPPPSARLEAMRAALAAEAQRPRRSWRTSAVQLAVASTGLALILGLGAIALGQTSLAVAAARWLSLLLVGVTGPLAVFAAVQPGRGMARLAAGVVAAAGAATLVLTRPATLSEVHTSPEWVCTLSHLGVALPAMVVASLVLRGFARSVPRSLFAGIAVGTTGALLGELMCGREAAHIAVFHLGAWVLATTAVMLASLALPRRSFAP